MRQSELHSEFQSVNTPSRAGEMAKLVKCLPEDYEGLSLSPGIQVKKMVVVADACNPSAEEVETGRFLGLRWGHLIYSVAAMTPTAPLKTSTLSWPTGSYLG